MARPSVVADASALICLGWVDQLQILPAVFGRIVVPPAVAAEVTHRQPTLPAWIDVREPRRPLDHRVVIAHLGAGETEVLSLGLELDGNGSLIRGRWALSGSAGVEETAEIE